MTEEARSTKDRILDAAEALLAERGPGETSLRDITAAAGVNLAAVNYHFQSKDALLRAVVDRRVVPMNNRRLELLDAAEAAAGKRGPSLARVIEAFVFPPLELIVTAPQFVPLMGRIYTEPQFVEEIIRKHMLPLKTRLIAALRRACPRLSDQAISWRMHFALGAMAHVLAGGHLIRLSSDGRCDPADLATTKRQLIAFLVAGFRAAEPKES
ncbi:MAG: TetR/AcrR family transcriptional regulator [Bryobacteraceae bacterium]|jgi:AcrR family transcriptional regulator